ncbi:MAG: hypothetical protein KDC85_17250 [Saprospiraceae bacterium]|nr:hypothetical protein [Saprospiraceae bacterium]
MTTQDFYQQFNQKRPFIQRLAHKLVNDFDASRFLYHETVHQAIKHKDHLQQDTFEEWLKMTMQNVYLKLTQGKS